jgi:hypothetical protein
MNMVKIAVVAVALVIGTTVVTATTAKAADVKVVTVAPYDTESFTVRMGAGRHVIGVQGDGDTVLVIRVYDEDGDLIASGTNYGGLSTLRLNAGFGGKVRVEVTNTGRLYNRFGIAVTD